MTSRRFDPLRSKSAWLFLFAIAVGCLSTAGAQAKIVIGLSAVNVGFLPVYVTKEKRFFEEQGLDVILVLFNSGTTNLQALIGGDVNIMGTSVVEPINARNAGVDVKVFWGVCNLMPFQLYSRPDFTSMKEAKGKRFAISRFGSLSDFLTRSALLQAGIDPKHVTILQIGSTPARFAALAGKGVDATVMWFPVTESAKQQGFKMLFDLKEVYPEWPFETFVAKAAWLNKEKETVTKLLRAYHKGVRYTLENREDAITVMKKWVKVESSVAAAGYDQYRQSFSAKWSYRGEGYLGRHRSGVRERQNQEEAFRGRRN
jgi:NitT/TauT family transport system substrate-binding protein